MRAFVRGDTYFFVKDGLRTGVDFLTSLKSSNTVYFSHEFCEEAINSALTMDIPWVEVPISLFFWGK